MGQAQIAVARRLREQAELCRRLGSPLYFNLLEQAAADVANSGPCWKVLEGHEGDSHGSALALRFMAAMHRLVLEGRAAALSPFYPSVGGNASVDHAWMAFRDTVEQNCQELRERVNRPVQTNEVGRSAALLAGFLRVAQATSLPLGLLEIGTSAGLNLRWDHYRYEVGGAGWGNPRSRVRFADTFVAGKPPFEVAARVVERRGCDILPVDPCSRDGRLTLMAYVWPDQTERMEQLREALEIARRVPALIDAASAAEWLASQLESASPGAATVVFQSIVMQYLDQAEQDLVRTIIEEAGSRATSAAPLAWLRMEPGDAEAEVRLTVWPGGQERLVATAGYHGRDIRWLAD